MTIPLQKTYRRSNGPLPMTECIDPYAKQVSSIPGTLLFSLRKPKPNGLLVDVNRQALL